MHYLAAFLPLCHRQHAFEELTSMVLQGLSPTFDYVPKDEAQTWLDKRLVQLCWSL
jgi:hypothetical protein